MKILGLRKEESLGGRFFIITPENVDVKVTDVIKNRIQNLKYVDYRTWKYIDAEEQGKSILVGRIKYREPNRNNREKVRVIGRGAILFKDIFEFIYFISELYIPEGNYHIDEFIQEYHNRIKDPHERKQQIERDLLDPRSGKIGFDENSYVLGPFYVIDKDIDEKARLNMVIIGESYASPLSLSYVHSIFRYSSPVSFLVKTIDFLDFSEPQVIIKREKLEVNGKVIPRANFILNEFISEKKTVMWDGEKLRFFDLAKHNYEIGSLHNIIEAIDSNGELYSSPFFEYFPIPQADIKFIVRIPSTKEVKEIGHDIEKIIYKTPPVKDTVYMIDTLSCLTIEQLLSVKTIIDDPEDALRIWSRTYSKIFVPDDSPSYTVLLPEGELYLVGLVI